MKRTKIKKRKLRPRKSSRGKAKGSAFERKVCKQLSRWVTHGKREDVFWRSAMSGGRATVGKRKGKDLRHQAGDISAVHSEGHALTDIFYIECKFYKDLDFGAFMFGQGKLHQFWKQTRKEAADHQRHPMLIAKGNLKPTVVLMRQGTAFKAFRDLPEMAGGEVVQFRGHGVKVIIIPLETLLTNRFDAVTVSRAIMS